MGWNPVALADKRLLGINATDTSLWPTLDTSIMTSDKRLTNHQRRCICCVAKASGICITDRTMRTPMPYSIRESIRSVIFIINHHHHVHDENNIESILPIFYVIHANVPKPPTSEIFNISPLSLVVWSKTHKITDHAHSSIMSVLDSGVRTAIEVHGAPTASPYISNVIRKIICMKILTLWHVLSNILCTEVRTSTRIASRGEYLYKYMATNRLCMAAYGGWTTSY